MMDQNDNKYINQYIKETSQIHAPVDLIQRTKQAVSEEEKRVQMESTLVMPEEKRRTNWHNKVFKWAIPAAAAAVLVLVLNMSVMLWGNGTRKSGMDSGSGMEAGEYYESNSSMNGSADIISEEAAESAADGAEMTGSIGMAGGAEESEGAEYAAAEAEEFMALQKVPDMKDEINAAQNESGSLSRGDSGNVNNLAEDSSADRHDGMSGAPDVSIENAEKKYSKEENLAEEITITKVKNAPAFYNDGAARRVVSRGITLYIAEDMNADDAAGQITAESASWKAYTEYNGGKYLITGQAANQDEFIKKAYEILEKTAEGS